MLLPSMRRLWWSVLPQAIGGCVDSGCRWVGLADLYFPAMLIRVINRNILPFQELYRHRIGWPSRNMPEDGNRRLVYA